MDYIKEMNAFYDLDMPNQLTPNAISLYFALLNIANKLYWKAEFVVSNLTLQSKAGIESRATLIRARNLLIQKGLITYKPSGKSNQAGSYTILGCVYQTAFKNETQSDTQYETQYETQSETQNDTINKQNKTKQKKKKEYPPDPNFDRFWDAYPKKVAKLDARKAWDELSPDDKLTERIINAVTKQRNWPQWQDKQFIPYPATWLRGRRWEDEQDGGQEPAKPELNLIQLEPWQLEAQRKRREKLAKRNTGNSV